MILAGAVPSRLDGQQHDHQPTAATTDWQWSVDGSVFFGFNYQYRKFLDFSAWESQNWMMAGGARRLGPGTFAASTMVSLEPWTLKDIGSPQAFQTGETYRRAPLIDFQHPHDLIMGLGATYRFPWRRAEWQLSGAVVGSPAFGPTVFMHRASAVDNPQAPLGHHYMDSVHVTPGVVTAGVTAREWSVEGSWFRGREPDENRTDLDLGPLDSVLGAARLGARCVERAGIRGRAHHARGDHAVRRQEAVRVGQLRGAAPDRRAVAWTAAFGQNREIHGNLEAYLLEGRMQLASRDAVYARAESVAKSILDAGFHPPGTFHRHRQSQVGAFTMGYVHDFWTTSDARVGIGGDVTGYFVPQNLREAYGAPVSFHVYVHYRRGPPGRAGVTHVH